MNFPIIRTTRCRITIATKCDVTWLYTLLNDVDVFRNIDGLRPFAETVESTTKFIDDMLDAYSNGRGFLWKLSYLGNPMGFICTYDFEDNPFLCYGIDKQFREKGFMTEALVSVLNYQNRESEKIYTLNVNIDNVSSYAISKRIKKQFILKTKLINSIRI